MAGTAVETRYFVRELPGQKWAEFEIRAAAGPIAIGETGDGTYATLFSVPYVGYLDKHQNKLVLLKYDGSSWVPVDESLFPQPPHPVEEIRHIAVAFDQAARLVMAYERAGEVFVYQWDSLAKEYVVRGPFPGADPVLINDATVGYYVPDSDVLLFHLTPDRLNLVMRVQRELYATAHTIQTFDQPVVLDQAVALPYQIELLGSLAGALDATGYALRSEIYPVRAEDALGSASLSAPTTGDYIPVVVIVDLGMMEGLGQATLTAPATGDYIPVVVIVDLGTEGIGSATLSAPATGSYVPVLVVQNLGAENLGTATLSAPTTGTYALVAVVVDFRGANYFPPGYEALGSATLSAPTTGSYELA